jgi:DNA polymerase-3 subunit alpha
MKYYTKFHVHDDKSNCNGFADSCTSHKEYIKLAKEQGMKSLAISNHGNLYDWVVVKMDCDKAGLKYIHGVETYLCTTLDSDERGYHIGLYAKNLDGVKELNSLISRSTLKGNLEDKSDRHFYYNPRISIDELTMTSDNIIITTACLASILWKQRDSEYVQGFLLDWFKLNSHRIFLEIQHHNIEDQKEYNKLLYKWSKEYGIRLIAGTDTHSSNKYKAECRKILQKAKKCYYGDEEGLDLVWKTYDELVTAYKIQNVLPEEVYLEAIENTNVFSDMIEHFELDKSFKYPNLYGDNAKLLWQKFINKKFKDKKDKGILKSDHKKYIDRIKEEFDAMSKQGMESFMLFMAELVDYCIENNIPYGPCRGSIGGSLIAFITDIIDLDPLTWNTIFSRFCNADRISLADIDIDFAPEDREKVFKWIINKFTPAKTAYIATFGTLKDRGTIDTLARGLEYKDLEQVKQIKNEFEEIFKDYSKILVEEINFDEHKELDGIDFDDNDLYVNIIRNNSAIIKINELKNNYENLKLSNKDIFYYFDGIKGTIDRKGNHAAGIIGSPITLADNIGVFYKDGDENTPICVCSMKPVDKLNFVKFDILGLKAIGVLKDTYNYIGSHYLRSYEINWNDIHVWNEMITSKVGCFQFEGEYAFDLLKRFKPQKINDMSIVNAALRPSGKSYRDKLISGEINKNPSEQIDELLKDNRNYLIFQEDTIKFLTEICGFSGSLADTTRRAIGKKDLDLLNEQLPKILDGYCKNSNKPRDIAEEEVKQFIQIISDSSEYQFGYNHSTGYSMIGYMMCMLRYYYPLEFTTAYLNRSDNDSDLFDGFKLAKLKGINVNPVRFRFSINTYMFDKSTNTIFKGLSSIKGFGEKNDIANQLLSFKDKQYVDFIDLLLDLKNTHIEKDQIEKLIKLDFFIEFGDSNKLIKIYEKFNILYNKEGRKQINFKDLDKLGLTEDIMLKHSKKLTKTLYKEFNIIDIIKECCNNIEYKKSNPVDKLIAEYNYYGYMHSTFSEVDKSFELVVEINIKYTPQIKCYSFATGEINTYTVYNNNFYPNYSYDNPNTSQLINSYDVLKILKVTEQKREKKKIINGERIKTGEFYYFNVLQSYKVALKYNK